MNALLASYVHQLDPYIFRIGNFGPRWYGLGYLLGFVVAILLLRWLSRRGCYVIPQEKVSDFIVYGAIFGVMLGGRLGYFLFYQPQELLRNPLSFFRLWDGGMASHGGILGLFFYTLYYAKRHGHAWTAVGDNLCLASTPGLFFVRIANFINGELWGRKTDVAWAMKFPEEVTKENFEPIREVLQAASQVLGQPVAPREIVELCRERAAVREAVAPFLHTRHPSQLYEAALEGLLLFLVLLAIRLRWRSLPNGLLTGLFFLLYAGARIFSEQFREPDHSLIGPLTRGQFYSSFMIAIGLAFLGFAWKSRKSPA